MPWDRGYYYRSTRRNGQPRREYVGKGPVAEVISSLDTLAQIRRRMWAAVRQSERRRVERLDRRLGELDRLADLVAHAALVAAGYHRPKRGEWRKRRGQHNKGPDSCLR